MAVDKAALLDNTRVLPTDTVEVPGVGEVVVRGLSRAEAIQVSELDGADAVEIRMLAAGMVDPELTVEEVVQWRSTKEPAEIRPVSDRILQLSGMTEEGQHEKERNFRTPPGDG